MPPITTFPAPPEPGNIYCMDSLEFLRQLPENYVDCIVTSPPYFGLRSYLPPDSPNKALEMGQEQNPAAYVANMVNVFREARRVLKATGNFWLNVGDSYISNSSPQVIQTKNKNNGKLDNAQFMARPNGDGLAPKNLLMIPHRLAIALQDDGWWVRQDNVWHKPNPMPESVSDRTTRAHEYVFHLTKSAHYYYDAEAIKETVKPHSIKRQGRAVSTDRKNASGAPGQTPHSMFKPRENINKQDALGKRQYAGFNERYDGEATPMANRRSVWTIPPANYKDAHFATFPERLAEICILAGCPPGGLVLDMFMGAGTVGVVAVKTGRQYIGCELNPDYVTLSRNRIAAPQQVNMFSAFCTGAPPPDAAN